MIEITQGDLLAADVDAIVNAVNCVGVMGRGIALQFKTQFPDNFVAYKRVCEDGLLRPGSMFVFDRGDARRPRFIVNFPTKDHWRTASRIEDIETGLVSLTNEIKLRGIQSIAIPALGCGLGGLPWDEVKHRIELAFADVANVKVQVFDPKSP